MAFYISPDAPRCPDSYLEKDSYVNGMAIALEVRGKGIPTTSSGRMRLLVARIFWIILDFCNVILESESGCRSFTASIIFAAQHEKIYEMYKLSDSSRLQFQMALGQRRKEQTGCSCDRLCISAIWPCHFIQVVIEQIAKVLHKNFYFKLAMFRNSLLCLFQKWFLI